MKCQCTDNYKGKNCDEGWLQGYLLLLSSSHVLLTPLFSGKLRGLLKNVLIWGGSSPIYKPLPF